MRKWMLLNALVLFSILILIADQGRKFEANADSDSEKVVDLPKVEDKIAAVPSGLSIDSNMVKREVESISKKSFHNNAEKFEFQDEVSRPMDNFLNSLCSKKEIFLRELISNSIDG
ncbi:hypothetical protein TanjilG_21413 [Lupinus angustifolius]|uniref:Uncharacterized protein n=1 Tax=Lupinus angustifolius TaxID=3871 RepID=A0A4P1RMS9_LUPAN|nr:hypothetical protein TanjilG_21413 [Lupinus angustifolius]